jgi:7 transmembrane helices usually fused to an inactive transglutaminase/Transglutaminase-like superfamily
MGERVTSKYKRTMRSCFPSSSPFSVQVPVRVFSLLVFWLLLCQCSALSDQEETQVFSGDEGLDTVSRSTPVHPATAYWKVTATMDLAAAPAGTHVQMLMPLSDERQSVLARQTTADGVNYREEADGLNLWGHWTVTGEGGVQRQIVYEYTVQIVDTTKTVPPVPFPLSQDLTSLRSYLSPSPLIQSDMPVVQEKARQIIRGADRTDHVLWALYQYATTLSSPKEEDEKNDALNVITHERGSRVGKTRALVALLRAVGIPARVVGGIRLGDTAHKQTTITWVEAWVGDTWIPMDPAAGYFAWLPNTYLALYRDDLPLLIHTRTVPVGYTFFIRQVPRSATLPVPPERRETESKRHGLHYESERIHTIATYVDHPLASIVFLNDGPIPQETIEQIVAEAQETQVNVAVLSADFESSHFREQYLQSLVSNNLTLIREADLLLVHTADTAGFYALMKQGEFGLRLDELRIVITSGSPRPVGTVLASVLVQLFTPREIVLVGRQLDLFSLWEIGRTSVREQLPLLQSVTRTGIPAAIISAATVAQQHWWRRAIVSLWTLAVQSQVSLPALNLILVLPLVAFFLVIIRNVIGLETFGTFSPMLLSLAFLTTGLGWGLVVFLILVGLGAGLRLILQRLRLHLVSRVAILIAVVALSMVGLTVLGATLGIGALLHVSIFPMVIMANIIENFTNTQLERGTGEAFRLTLNTLLVATSSYIGIEYTGLKPLVLTFPELLLGVIAIELLLGRWRGLRVVEYMRFYGVLSSSASAPVPVTRKVSAG